MTNTQKLFVVKGIHTLIWVFYNLVIFYMLYAAITNRIDIWFMICFGLVFLEGIILLFFRFTCPLTLIAQRYTEDRRYNFDIFLPEWLARYTKLIYTSIVVIIIAITIFYALRQHAIV